MTQSSSHVESENDEEVPASEASQLNDQTTYQNFVFKLAALIIPGSFPTTQDSSPSPLKVRSVPLKSGEIRGYKKVVLSGWFS